MILAGKAPALSAVDRSTTLSAIVERYLRCVTPRKRSSETERYRLMKLLRDPICDTSLATLSAAIIADYRDRRMVEVGAGTIRRELSLLNHMLDLARREWGILLAANPVADVAKPRLNNARTRRLKADEWVALRRSLEKSRNPLMISFVRMAIETALRRGELLDLRWSRIDWQASTAHIPRTKTDRSRTIPLTPAALRLLESLSRGEDRVFPFSANSVKLAWVRATKRAGIVGLRFHDLRHEAVSSFFEMGLSMPEVALISGHRDPRMLFRYTHLEPANLARKLGRLCGRN